MLADHFGPEIIVLGEPKRITGDVVICFRGSVEARFRVQHASDRGGQPDELSWCDVTMLSDRNIDPNAAIDKDGGVCGPLVGKVEAYCEATYRRHSAGWLRIIPDEDNNKEEERRCAAYNVTLRPAPP